MLSSEQSRVIQKKAELTCWTTWENSSDTQNKMELK